MTTSLPLALPLHYDKGTTPHKPTVLSFQKPLPTHVSSILDGQVSSGTYASVLESCTCRKLLKQVHGHALKSGFNGHEFVETKLLQVYGKFSELEDAILLFDKMTQRNVYSWAAVMSVCVDNGLFEEALSFFMDLRFTQVGMEFFVLPVVLKICTGIGVVELGRQLHGFAIKYRFDSNAFVSNALIDMYGKCRSVNDAKKVFCLMPERDRVSWNSVITACAANGMAQEALSFLERMSGLDGFEPNLISWSAVISAFSQVGYDVEAIGLLSRMQEEGWKPNAQTLASVLPACARLQSLMLGKELHGYVTRHGFMSNRFVVNGLLDVYRRCSDMESALNIFTKFSVRNVVSFNTMIVGYCENGNITEAKKLFDQMELVGSKKDITSWNAMISGYVNNSMIDEALSMFQDLLKEEGMEVDSFTLGSILRVYSDMASLREGKQIHSQAIIRGLHSNYFVGGALVEMYFSCQDLPAAQMAFNEVTERDTATWNALISGYARSNQIENISNLLDEMIRDGFEPNIYTYNGILVGYVENSHNELALQLFSNMLASGLRPDIYTIGVVLPACSRLAAIERAKQVHAYSIRCGYESEVYIGAALVDVYAKCGSIKKAELVYQRISCPNLVSRNALLTAYATHGCGEQGITFFRSMLADGERPDNVTFLSVLSSCVHVGSVEAALEYIDLMKHYNIRPSLKHYTCLVDLLSRAGMLNEAYDIIKSMPVEEDPIIWSALLGGCAIHENVELGEIAAKKLMDMEPDNTGNQVIVANFYASGGQWTDLAKTRKKMKDRGMHKDAGCSWIENKEEIHVFLASDSSHERKQDIYAALDALTLQMRTYHVQTKFVT